MSGVEAGPVRVDTADAPPLAEPRRVFVIDDDDVMLLVCRRTLEKDHYLVETFSNGHDGIRRLADVKPQLLLVDLKMPELNGLEVIERVRAIDPHVVIAVITGYATIATAVDAMKAGAYDFLPKPFTPDELRLIVKRGCERWQLAHESERLRQEKEAGERRFITFVSHQLKSPLAAIRQYLDVLLFTSKPDLPPTAVQWITRSQARLEEMLGLIDDWLTLAKLERGSLGERDATTDLCQVIAQVKEATRPQAEAAHVEVTLDLAPESLFVKGDAVSLATVVSNLVTNAITYNRPGGRVAVRVAADDKMATLEVRDTGIGIPEDCLPRIFEEFFRVGRERGRDVPGTGLGLAICRRIVIELGGAIDVSSTLGEGSTFTVRLPVGRPQSER
jgi:two-component system sensor histidine kinase/response regulator